MEITLIVVAAAFAMFAGANDGGPLLLTSLKVEAVRPIIAAAVLTASVVTVPALFGTQVATTLTSRLVDLHDSQDRLALALAVGGAVAVVLALARGGLPTSLTLALVGGIVGAGIGGGRPVSWSWVSFVLVLAVAAPVVGLLAAYGIGRLWGRLRLRTPVGRQARRAHWLGLFGQAFAYGANDGQKALAVFALAIPAAMDGDHVVPPPWLLLVVGGLFATGLVIGARRYGIRLSATVSALSPVHGVTAQMSAAVAVTGSAGLGAPVSMTQVISGALVGTGLTHGVARVRWQHALRILGAWVLTIPIAAAVAAAPAAVLLRA